MSLTQLRQDLYKLKNPVKARLLQRFFKTGKGEYAQGDKFLGIMVPKSRALVKKYWQNLSLKEVDELIKSPWHEERLIGLLILVKWLDVLGKDSSASDAIGLRMTPRDIYKFYLNHTKYINNWDLVDLTAPKIVGACLRNKNKSVLLKLAKSKNLWERRIAVLSTFDFVYYGDPAWTLKISRLLINDKHDLIHKAAGWMLREVGKRCSKTLLLKFLDQNAHRMPRTMLRYSIERLDQKLKLKYMAK
jgi:3-methyladenine DNA glycosylase AlkD